MTWVLVYESIDKRALVGSVYEAAIWTVLSFSLILFSSSSSNAC